MYSLISNLKKKIRSSAGLSLTEMLATVVLVGLLGITVATGVTTISNTYLKIVRKANEQTLLSTTLIEMRAQLRQSTFAINNPTDKSPIICSKDGYWFQFVNTEETGIAIRYYVLKDNSFAKKKEELELNDFVTKEVNEKGYLLLLPQEDGEISDVYSYFDSINYNNGVFTINGLVVKGSGDEGTALKQPYVIAQITTKIGGAG